MTSSKLLTLLNVSANTWTTLPDVLSFEFSNQRYIHTTENKEHNTIIRWWKILNLSDGDPVLLLQNRSYNGDVFPEGIKYDNESDIHQIFYIDDIVGIAYR